MEPVLITRKKKSTNQKRNHKTVHLPGAINKLLFILEDNKKMCSLRDYYILFYIFITPPGTQLMFLAQKYTTVLEC